MDTDILSDVLRSLRASGTVYFCDELKAPWEKQFPGEGAASFHQVRRGGCYFQSDGVEEYLGPGDLVFVEAGRAHTLTDQPRGELSGTNNPATLLLCGYCEFDDSPGVPLSSLFPVISLIRDEQLQSQLWLRTLLDTLSGEFLSNRPGTRIVVNKLTEVFMVELIRMNFGQTNESALLRALSDKKISKALQLLHGNPEQPWTLDSLAAEVGMSRAGFAKRFKDLVEHSMFDYLTRIRLQCACELLSDTQMTLYEIAYSIGYDSDLSFARTFKKRLGLTPTAYRKESEKNHTSEQSAFKSRSP